MQNYRSRFTYLWLLIVACCVVTKPAVAAPVSARVITVPCVIDGRKVEKQILLIGVLHTKDGKENDIECFAKLSSIIERFTDQHKDKTMPSIPILLEAPDYRKDTLDYYSNETFRFEWKLAKKYLGEKREKGKCSFDFIQADDRIGPIVRLIFCLGISIRLRKWDEKLMAACGSFQYYKNLCDNTLEMLESSCLAFKGLLGSLDTNIQLTRSYSKLVRYLQNTQQFFCFLETKYLEINNTSKSSMHQRDIIQILMELQQKSKIDSGSLSFLDHFLVNHLAHVGFFSKLVHLLADHDKIILFCGSAHVEDPTSISGWPDSGMVPLFRDFGCTVEEIESHPISDNQKYIDASRLQEIFTDFLDCCNTCGKTKAHLLKGEKMKSCRGCHAVTYCSRECQGKDWKKHKKLSPGCAKKKKK